MIAKSSISGTRALDFERKEEALRAARQASPSAATPTD
jgi:hypothetical protein